MPASTYLRNKLTDHVLKVASYTAPTNIAVSLHSADPGLTGANELSGGSYARVIHNTWATSSAGASSNTGTITFPTATGNWTAATHFGVWDASSAGNFLGGAALTVSKTVLNGDTASFASGALTWTTT